ncbi:MAG: DUF2142 domain-containing protein [Acidobacteriota bacterium]|nr:DUF2142 domain-containing protein [Acidobacteriota bacterium]
MTAARHRGRRAGVFFTPRQVFWGFFALTFVAMACWSFADPLVAAPDEQAHMIRAYAISHGQIGHQVPGPDKALVDVTVPTSVNFTKAYPRCFQFRGAVSAACAPAFDTSTAPVVTDTYVGHYPPLYYVLVGLPSYLSAHVTGLYLMRLASSAICALMVALSAYVVARWSRRRVLAAGVAVAMTPITWFLASSVNPSGFEIVTAICLWTSLAVLAADYVEDPPVGLVAIIGASGAVLTLIRGLSPLFVALIGVVIAVAVGPVRLWALVRRRRDVQWALGAIAGAAVLAAAWIFTQHTLSIAPDGAKVAPGTSEYEIMRLVAHHIRDWIRQAVGVMGWLDTPMPHWFYDLWYLMIAVLFVGGLVLASVRVKVALAGIAVLSVLVPFVLVVRQVHQLGIVWQGRDLMPLAVGVPILAAGMWSRSRRSRVLQRNVSVGIVGLVAILTMGSFYLNLRRYAVGRAGSRLFFVHSGGWSPPTGSFLTLAVYGVVTAALAGAVIMWLLSARHGDDDAFAPAVPLS